MRSIQVLTSNRGRCLVLGLSMLAGCGSDKPEPQVMKGPGFRLTVPASLHVMCGERPPPGLAAQGAQRCAKPDHIVLTPRDQSRFYSKPMPSITVRISEGVDECAKFAVALAKAEDTVVASERALTIGAYSACEAITVPPSDGKPLDGGVLVNTMRVRGTQLAAKIPVVVVCVRDPAGDVQADKECDAVVASIVTE